MLMAMFIMMRLLDGKQKLGHRAAKMDLTKLAIKFHLKKPEIIKTGTAELLSQRIIIL
jgi:hypothetical protein